MEHKKRNPALAALFNVFCPGLGAMYTGFLTRGLLLGVAILAFYLIYLLIVRYEPYYLFLLFLAPLWMIVDGVVSARKANREKRPPARFHTWYFYLLFVLGFFTIHLAASELVKHYWIRAYKVPSGSMIPNVLVGDHFINKKFDLEINRGDVVVFKVPHDDTKESIKRVVGLPGDQLVVGPKSLTIDGVEVSQRRDGDFTYDDHGHTTTLEKYIETINGKSYPVIYESEMAKMAGPLSLGTGMKEPTEVTVPAGKYFVLGDNRNRSNDSRFFGFVDQERVSGEVVFIYWPPGRYGAELFVSE